MEKNSVFKLIEYSLNKKYRQIIYSKEDIKKILKIRIKLIRKKTRNAIKIKSDFKRKKYGNKILTNELLRDLSIKQKLSKKDKILLFKFYKKFSINLKLLKSYNKFLKPLTKVETNYDSYIYMGNLVNYINQINKIQKLNFLLKINDKVFIKAQYEQDLYLLSLFKQNLKRELNLIKFFSK